MADIGAACDESICGDTNTIPAGRDGVGAVKGGTPSWHFTIVSSAFALGNVFAPYTLGAGGLLWGSIFWIFSSATTWWSGILIGHCVLDGKKRGVDSTYPAMMQDAFGQPGYWFTVLMQLLTYYMFVAAMLVNFASWLLLAWQAAWGSSGMEGLCLWQWILVAGAMVAVLAQIQTFKQVLPLAAISLATTIARQLIMYYQIGSMDLYARCEPQYGGITMKSVINSMSTTAFLYGGHGMFPEEIREMREPNKYFGALHATYVICITVYFSNAYVAYYIWGDWVAGDIQFNWPANNATLLSALLSGVWCVIEITISFVLLLGLVERTLVDPEAIASHFYKHFNVRLPSSLLRKVLRSLIVISVVALAFMLNSAGIADLQAMVGALGFTALTYYAPFAAYWKLIAQKKDPIWKQLAYLLCFTCGVFVMLVGIYGASASIHDAISAYSLFDTSICNSNDVVDLAACANPCREVYGLSDITCSVSVP